MIKYKLSYEAYQEYITITKNNENTSFELAEKKLNRNIMCGKFIHEYNMVEKYHYGTLVIKTSFGEIIKVHKSNCRRKFDGEKRYKLNRLMGIVD